MLNKSTVTCRKEKVVFTIRVDMMKHEDIRFCFDRYQHLSQCRRKALAGGVDIGGSDLADSIHSHTHPFQEGTLSSV